MADVLVQIRGYALALPLLAKFAVGMAVIVGVPMLARKVRIPAGVALMLGEILIGPYCLDIFGEKRPIADFFAELGKLLRPLRYGREKCGYTTRERRSSMALGSFQNRRR